MLKKPDVFSFRCVTLTSTYNEICILGFNLITDLKIQLKKRFRSLYCCVDEMWRTGFIF